MRKWLEIVGPVAGHSRTGRKEEDLGNNLLREEEFKTRVVAIILDSSPEKAIQLLSDHFRVREPKLGVGVFKGHSRGIRAVYSPRRKEILAAKREYLYDPFTVLHEFYHHLRSFGGEHRGTEKHADRFAADFILAYNRSIAGDRQVDTSLDEEDES